MRLARSPQPIRAAPARSAWIDPTRRSVRTSAPPTTTMLVMARIAITVTRRRQNTARCGAADLVRRLSDEGNEPRAELIRGPERCWRVTAGDHFEIAVIYGKEIEVGEPYERLDDLRDYALVACVDCVPEVGHLRDQLRDVVGLL